MTVAELRAFGAVPFRLIVRPRTFQKSWPNFRLLDANGCSIAGGAVRTSSLHALTRIVFESHRCIGDPQ